MKTQKRILKIGLSLMIALFMLSSTFVLADGPEAGVTDYKEPKEVAKYEAVQKLVDPISQDPCPVWIIGLVGIGDGDTIPIGTYPLTVIIWNEPGCGPATVKVFADIYKKTEGMYITMYYTSFEDNFDIYNNWIQIDGDCGEVGGHYDSWSWSDARAYCDDHSFKSTMYDIYKGNQEDYLQCTKSFDVSDQEAVIVEFYAWVEGDGQNLGHYYWPYDYLDFEVGDQYGNWFNPYDGQNFVRNGNLNFYDGSYMFHDTSLPVYYSDYYYNLNFNCGNDVFGSGFDKVEDMGNGWWKITWRESVSNLQYYYDLDVTDIMFRFSWHTDPEQQFEGAYVDCFKVISVERMETKVFQTHSQGTFIIPECESRYTFPLPWPAEGDDTKVWCYDIRLWLEVIDDDPYQGHYSLNDWPFYVDIHVCVSDWYDVEVVDGSLAIEESFGGEDVVPGDGVMDYGSDAHIMAQIHVGGTKPASDITVTATAHKKIWSTLYETDFESGMGWTLSGGAHWTTTYAWSGSKSLGMFEQPYTRYANDAFYVAEYAGTFSVKDNLELFADFYSRYVTETSYDVGRFCLIDNYHNFVLGLAPGLTGYQPEWIGPLQPMSSYQSYDIIDGYNFFETTYGFFHDGNGDQVYDVPIGFYFSPDDTINYYSSSIMESGVWIDDLSVRGLTLGDEVWKDTIIIPGPVEPCEIVDVQFEWEDPPYCNYLICITATCPGQCFNLKDEPECAQILVVTDLEMMHWKEAESHDYTGEGEGEWGISSSDYDNYLASNADGTLYPASSNSIAQLCPGGDTCIDISHLFSGSGAPETVYSTDFSTFDWTSSEFAQYTSSYGIGTPPEAYLSWSSANDLPGTNTMVSPTFNGDGYSDLFVEFVHYLDYYSYGVASMDMYLDVSSNGGSTWNLGVWSLTGVTADVGPVHIGPISILAYQSNNMKLRFRFESIDTFDMNDWYIDDVLVWGPGAGAAPPASLIMEFDAWWDLESGYDYGYIEVANCPCDTIDDWHLVAIFSGCSEGITDDGWVHVLVDLVFTGMQEEICVRFRLESDPFWNMRGMKIDNLLIQGVFGPDPMDNMNNWCTDILHYGQFWVYDDLLNQWCTNFPAYPVEDALIWTTEINNAYEAYLVYETEYAFGTYAEGRVQVSGDGNQWYTLDVLTGSSGGLWETYHHNLNYYVGGPVFIRFLALGGSPYSSGGHWCVRNVQITGKEDNMAPNTMATITGTQTDAGWFNSAVTITITATDVGAGMGDIHYILDGVEKVVSGSTATFKVTTNGAHNVEYWGVDKVGNEETPHNTIPTFRIDFGAPPTVSIDEPTTGLYLFGNKLLSLSKIFIIGAFNIEATASDAESGVYRVQFLLDGDIIAEDTEAPYSAYCALKHSGAGVIKVIAEDFSGNIAEDTLDITYYKFL